MMMKCDVPLPSTPDALDIYLDNIETTVHPTEAATEGPTEGPTEESTEEATEESTEESTEETTEETTETITGNPNESAGCQFYEEGNRAVFDTGSPYSNNMRPGYIDGSKRKIFFFIFRIIDTSFSKMRRKFCVPWNRNSSLQIRSFRY